MFDRALFPLVTGPEKLIGRLMPPDLLKGWIFVVLNACPHPTQRGASAVGRIESRLRFGILR